MKYEVRYLVNGDEQTTVIDAETAAEAVQTAQSDQSAESTEGQFELIQVQLIDEVEEYTTPANDDEFDPQ